MKNKILRSLSVQEKSATSSNLQLFPNDKIKSEKCACIWNYLIGLKENIVNNCWLSSTF